MFQMNKKNISIGILLLYCLYIYPVMFRGNPALSYLYIYGIPFVYLVFRCGSLLRLKLNSFLLIVGSFLLVGYGYIVPFLHGTNDYSYMRVATYALRKLVVYLFLYFLTKKTSKEKYTSESFMLYFSITQAVYVMGTIFLVFIPGLKSLWFTLFDEVTESESFLQSFGYTFRIGWQGFSGYEYTIHCSLSCIFLLYLYYGIDNERRINARLFWMSYILSFVGNMFYGRSGLVVSIMASLIAVLFWNRQSPRRIWKYVVAILIGLVVLVNLEKIPFFSDWIYWMSNPIKNLLTTGSFNNASIQATSSDIVFPGWRTFLFGDGRFTENFRYYMRTDSGIMRNLYYWGIVGTIPAYVLTISSISTIKKGNMVAFLMILCSFFAFEYKGLVYCEFLAIFMTITIGKMLDEL